MRVSQQLDYWGRLAYVPRERRAELVADSLRRFGLVEFATLRVDRMSMGQRQRIRLAMAFLHEPRVLLLDEPRNSLDDDGYRLLNEQIEQAAKRGATVLWCSPRGEDRVIACDAELYPDRGLPGASPMSRMTLWCEAMWGIIRRDAILFVSYRSQLVAQFLGPLFSITLFYYISHLVTAKSIHSPGGYFGFVIVGLVIVQILTISHGRDAGDGTTGTRLGHDRAFPR